MTQMKLSEIYIIALQARGWIETRGLTRYRAFLGPQGGLHAGRIILIGAAGAVRVAKPGKLSENHPLNEKMKSKLLAEGQELISARNIRQLGNDTLAEALGL